MKKHLSNLLFLISEGFVFLAEKLDPVTEEMGLDVLGAYMSTCEHIGTAPTQGLLLLSFDGGPDVTSLLSNAPTYSFARAARSLESALELCEDQIDGHPSMVVVH